MSATSSVELSSGIISIMQEALSAAQDSGGKSVVAFVGNTGSGKSTSINYLAGCEMVRQNGRVTVKPPGEPITTIGHGRSETMLARVYEVGKRCFADTGGFLDTRGVVSEVIVPFSAKWTLQNAKGVKLVLCVNQAIAGIDRGTHLTELFKTTLGRLTGQDFEEHLGRSFSVLFTHVQKTPTDDVDDIGEPIMRPTVHSDFLDGLCFIRELYAEGSLERRIYDFVVRDEGKYVSMIQPSDKGTTRETILEMIDTMASVDNPAECFAGIPHSPSTMLQIKATMEGIAVRGKELLDAFARQVAKIEECNAALQKIAAKVASLRSALSNLGNTDPGKVEQAKKELREKLAAQIDAKRQSIADHKKMIEAATKAKAVAEESLAELEKKKDEIQEYHKWAIDKPAHITPAKKIASRTWHGHLWGWKGRDVWSDEIRHEVRDVFRFSGPNIAEIVMDPPADSKRWSNSQGGVGTDHFNVDYASEAGQPGVASISVKVRHEDLPAVVLQTMQHKREVQDQEIIVASKNAAIAKDEAEITKLEHMKEVAQRDGDHAVELGGEIDQLEGEKAQVGRELAAAEEERESIRGKLRDEKGNLDFLRQYLTIAKDDSLANSPFVTPYLQVPNELKSAVFESSSTN